MRAPRRAVGGPPGARESILRWRRDVIALGFIQTTITEMGQPPEVQDADPAMRVRGRPCIGRTVTVTNDKIFDEPVYNDTYEFSYIWEEMAPPVAYSAVRVADEGTLLEAAGTHAVPLNELGEAALTEMERRSCIKRTEMGPGVYDWLTDNWLELTVR